MGAEEADAGGVEQQADGHTPFIASGSAHSGFDRIHGDVPESHITNERENLLNRFIFFQGT